MMTREFEALCSFEYLEVKGYREINLIGIWSKHWEDFVLHVLQPKSRLQNLREKAILKTLVASMIDHARPLNNFEIH